MTDHPNGSSGETATASDAVNAPKAIKEGVNKAGAEEIEARMETVGGTVELEQASATL